MRQQLPGASPGNITRRIAGAKPGSIVISMVTVSEMMKGVLNLLQKMEKAGHDVAGFDEMERFYKAWQLFPLIPYTDDAHAQFNTFSALTRRIGRPDCQIGAIALANGYTVVTANTRHFAQIPGIVYEDWTRLDAA